MKYDGDVNYAADPYGMPSRQSASKRGLLALGFAVVGVVAFAGTVVVGFRGHDRIASDGPPLLTADPGPVKARPDQPGGLEVPHQDILAYERLRDHDANGKGNPAVERLLPPPEVPLPRPVVTPQMPAAVPLPTVPSVAQLPPGSTATVPRDSVAAAVAAAAPLVPPEPLPGQPTAMPPAAVPPAGPVASASLPPPNVAAKPQPAPVAGPRPQPTATAPKPAAPPAAQASAQPIGQLIAKLESASLPAAPAAKTAPQPAKPAVAAAPTVTGGSGGWRVQLASVRSEAEAAAEWKRLAGRHSDALGGLSMQVAKVDLGDKGTFYRVQGAGADEARAKSVCALLRAQNVGCVVVRP
ncbi:SPOR domain-containing protein [Azospirillum sp. TSO35-2]|uniref:SPOR domain-containing protein n=1 Tax=Azospirillum sp. TSO35-2 TaxID=716796 RepID=UPI000D61FAA3|nr:SPOR domain-containing protein [Azospirillum sp. TSO35-2]PWC34348.1 hypothetical protein TSO352_29195 [Azospirillum sp. TSO35-2]